VDGPLPGERMTARAQSTFRISWLSPVEPAHAGHRQDPAQHTTTPPAPCAHDAMMSETEDYPMSDSPCVLDSTPN
jgi:hypothetical protein